MYRVGDETNIRCPFCGEYMFVDDIDYNFRGNYDVYLLCHTPSCNCSATCDYRYSKLTRTCYFKDGDIVKEIKHNTSNLNGSEFD